MATALRAVGLGLILSAASAASLVGQEAKRHLPPPVQAACAKAGRCVSSCDGVEASDEPPYSPTAQFSGSFSAPGAEEAVVSLFPCGELLSKRQAGLTALLRKTRSRWSVVTSVEDALLQDECRPSEFKGRSFLLCQASVGPDQGIMTSAVCFTAVVEGALEDDCPLRVTDVTASGCFQNDAGTGRRTWQAAVRAWTPAMVGGLPGVRVEVEVASVAAPRGDGLDAGCERAIRRLGKMTPEVLHLELAFDGRHLALTPESRKIVDRYSWILE